MTKNIEEIEIFAHDFAVIKNDTFELQNFKNIFFSEDVYEAIKNADMLVM
jgi:hypothetical protein